MDKLKKQLIKITKNNQDKDDPSHDFQHVLRVLNIAEEIANKEAADLDIVIPAALFHDIVISPKNSKHSKNDAENSAKFAEEVLKEIKDYPKDKIKLVKKCISECSFSKNIKPKLLESKILQDADMLEATGAIAIMRTFASSGQMNRKFYEPSDPFCDRGSEKFRSGLDLFYQRLLVVESRIHTNHARKIAKRRTEFLRKFLDELKLELKESKIIQ